MRRAIMTAVAIVIASGLAGCSSPDAAPAGSTPPPSASATPTMPNRDNFSPPPTGLTDDDTGDQVSPKPVPTWDTSSRSAAITAAERVMTAFARPDLPYKDWWAAVEPLMSQKAREDYSYVDPANVPVSKVTGPGKLVDESSAYIGYVEVPTNVGTYTVILSRADAAADWFAERITPPEGVK